MSRRPAVSQLLAALALCHKGFDGFVRELCADTPSHGFFLGSISLDTPVYAGC